MPIPSVILIGVVVPPTVILAVVVTGLPSASFTLTVITKGTLYSLSGASTVTL